MATDIATRELREPIDVAEYLFRRLREVGIRSVHGVPGENCPVADGGKCVRLRDTSQVTTTSLLWITSPSAISIGWATAMN